MLKKSKGWTKSKNVNSKRYKNDLANYLHERSIKCVTERVEGIEEVIGRSGVIMKRDDELVIYCGAETIMRTKIEDLYAYMRDKRGYDAMDEYIREEVLQLQGVDYTVLEKVTGECASRVYNALMHQRLEPGTKEAFNGYVACLHQLYLMGAAMQLKRMGYHMTKMN